MIKCNCKDWKENIDKLNAGFQFLAIHKMGGYVGKQIEYCPWCAKKLFIKEEKKEK